MVNEGTKQFTAFFKYLLSVKLYFFTIYTTNPDDLMLRSARLPLPELPSSVSQSAPA